MRTAWERPLLTSVVNQMAATRKLKSNKTRVGVFAYNTRGVLPSVFEEETVR